MATPPPPCPPPSYSSSFSTAAVAPTAAATTSSCMMETSQGAHVFRVYQYSQIKDLAAGKDVTSSSFDVGGFGWAVRLYPSGMAAPWNTGDRMLLHLVAKKPFSTRLKIKWEMSLCDQTTRRWRTLLNGIATVVAPRCVPIDTAVAGNYAPVGIWVKKIMLEAPDSSYLRNDHFDIRCDITVIPPPRVSETLPLPQITCPPPGGLSNDLAALLDKDRMADADVTFHVQGETFAAHRAVLAARSPVFMAALVRDTTREKETGHVKIEDVQSAVFGVFLHFIYTDTLPAAMIDDPDGDDRIEMLRHLLVAADRYDVASLKQLCESLLCDSLDVRTVRTTLTLAKHHHCDLLKEACEEFLKATSG